MWGLKSRSAFFAFGSETFVEWTRFLFDSEKAEFISDVLDRYRSVAADNPAEENTFTCRTDEAELRPRGRLTGERSRD